jgi:hypothetical protein
VKRYDGTILLAEEQSWVVTKKHSLQDYTWDELKIIANNLSMRGTRSAYYAHMLELMQAGSKKTSKLLMPKLAIKQA